MKRKKIYILLICVAFLVALVLSFTFLFTVRFTEVKFSSSETEIDENICSKIDSFKGKNILLLNENEVKNSLNSFYNYKVVSVKKYFCNKIVVNVKQREEMFAIKSENKVYITDEEGVILKTIETFSPNRKLVLIENSGLVFDACSVGQALTCNDNELLYKTMEMAEKINYYDCIKKVSIEKATEKQFAYFYTYSGVILEIPDVLERGIEKIEVAFNEYDNCENDYTKSFNKIIVSIQEDGSIKATWVNSVN